MPELLEIVGKYYDELGNSVGLGPSAVVIAVKDIIETFLAVRPQRNVHGIIL